MGDTIEDVASAASKRANHVDTKEAHIRAGDLRRQAAAEARARKDTTRTAHHQKWADHHAKRANELGSSSASTNGGLPPTDSPTQGNADPLLTWASTPRGR